MLIAQDNSNFGFWHALGLILGVALISLLPNAALAAGCFEVSILSPAPFLGNDKEVVKLSDGSLWQVQNEYNYMYQFYPSAQICPSAGKLIVNGKALTVVPLSPAPKTGVDRPAPRAAAPITVVLVKSGCDYFVADGPQGYYFLEWFGGHSPSNGDAIAGDLSSFGFKDVFYANANSQGRVWVDDYLLSRSRAVEKFTSKCN